MTNKLIKPRHSLPSDESPRRASPSPTSISFDLESMSSNPIAFPSHDRDSNHDEPALKLRKPSLLKIVKRNSIRGLRSISFKKNGSESDSGSELADSPSKKRSSRLSSIHIPHLRFSSSASHSSQSSQSSSSGESLQTAVPISDPQDEVDVPQVTRKRRVSLPSFRLLLPKSSSKNLREEDSDKRTRTLSYAVPLSPVGPGGSAGPDTEIETAPEDVPPGLAITDIPAPALSIPLPPSPSTPLPTLLTPPTLSTHRTPSRLSIPPTPKPVPSDDDIDSSSPPSDSDSNSDSSDTESTNFDPDCDHLYPYPLALSLLGKPRRRPTTKSKSKPTSPPQTPLKKRVHLREREDEIDMEGPFISHTFIRVPVSSVRLRRPIGFHLVWWLKA